MKNLAFIFLLVAGLGFTTVSCEKEKTCTCTDTYTLANGDEYQDSDTREVTTEGSCSDLNSTSEDDPVEGVTKNTDCEEK